MSRRTTKPTKWHVRLAKTQIRLGIRPVWSESSLSARSKLGSLATHWAHSEDSDQTGHMSRLIWVFAGRTVSLLVLREVTNIDLHVMTWRSVWPIIHGPMFLPYILKAIGWMNFKLSDDVSVWRKTFDLKMNVGHCDIYFTVQWFCLISWRLFDVWWMNVKVLGNTSVW